MMKIRALIRRLRRPLLVLCAFSGPWNTLQAEHSRPNILIIYADDVGYGDLGCYGSLAIDTPSLDALAREGIRFTSAYATASTCTPSRYSLLTGEYAFRNRSAKILSGNAPLIIDPAKPTLASMLRSVGYRTGLVGKWHLGLGHANQALDWNDRIAPGPRELGFEYSFHMAATGDRVPTVYIENGRILNLDPSDPIEVSYGVAIGNDATGLSHPHRLKVQADEQHAKTIVDGISRIGYMTGGHAARWKDEEMSDTFLQYAVDFIEKADERPFFLYYATHENHVPRVPHPRFRGSSSLGVRGDAVVQMDWNVGILLKTLEERGLRENTMVIFSSDNGPVLFDGYYDGALQLNGDHEANGPWYGGKYSAWEGGTRVPFIVSWPAEVNPGLSDSMVSQVDLLASLASLTGGSLPEGAAEDSQDLIKVFLGKDHNGRQHVVQQGATLLSLRSGDWKYLPPGQVRDRSTVGLHRDETVREPGALYFLPEDPEERNNLASRYPAKARELRQILEAELGDTSSLRRDGNAFPGQEE